MKQNTKFTGPVFTRSRSKSMIATTLLLAGTLALAQSTQDPLKSGFENPPNGARPRVWWHWMNGNITEEGIKLDLEWMHRVGLGGFQNFDAALGTPQVVEHRLAYMTPEWKQTFLYATKLADQLGLEEAIAGSPGWSETGGPWVPASQGMKKYVWSETKVEGGTPFTGTLAKPPSNTGAFQNLAVHDMLPAPDGSQSTPQFYADSAVIAYRVPASDADAESLHAKLTVSAGSPDLTLLSDGDLDKTAKLPIPEEGKNSWIQYDFPQPQTIRAVTIVTKDPGEIESLISGLSAPDKALEASDDGQNFHQIVALPGSGAPEHTLSFSPVTARYFRVTFKRSPPPPRPPWMGDMDPASLGMKLGPPPTDYEIAELVLHSGARVNRFEEKAAFVPVPDLYQFATAPVPAADVVSKSDVVDLTSKMHPDGTLEWTPPAGKWVVLRFGYSLLGITNHPATAEATGLEVDKLNRSYVKNYLDHYLDNYKSAVGADWMGSKGVKFVITDSWEAGAQNWTDDMIAEFKKRRGYDPVPWMPVLTGRVVESAEASDRFLWDLRKTIADLIADEHYGQVEASLKARGMGHYGESHESGRALIADGMEVKKLNEVPMSAMWTQTPGVNKEQYGYNADDRESASVGHIYGQNLAAAESMTAAAAPWAWSPATLKPTADKEMAEGINRFVIHCSVHQPLVGKVPGLGLGPFGQWFTRNETWAEEAGPWVNYLARSSYLLQQGHFGADILYFYGEDSNVTAIFDKKSPDVPAGYGFDYVNADALIHMFKVQDGNITTASGMSYKLLALDPYSVHMSLPVLRSIRDLVKSGAIVAGAKPVDTPSLADDPKEFNSIAAELWGTGSGIRTVGKGKVYAGMSLTDAVTAMKLPPDFDYSKPESDTNILFVHRKLADGDLYYIDNRNDRDETVDATFRVTGKEAELWHGESGDSEPASYKIADGHTTVPLHLEPWGTVFVVFRKPADGSTRTLPKPAMTDLATIDGPWTVSFQPDRGAPASITMEKLASWSESSNDGVKYFSGNGTYTQTVNASADWFKPGAQLWIDLGDVKNLAVVTVNGKQLGTVWHAPYRVDATSALKPGANQISIQVTNAWVNRLIGDQQPNAQKYTFTVIHPYKANSPLLASGLLGPVRISSAMKQ
ncbi:glycosyl hydrolase [Acidisarcina polymorpha]|nr:glycosyl hydrolase [Acidisarcina polymorpha]